MLFHLDYLEPRHVGFDQKGVEMRTFKKADEMQNEHFQGFCPSVFI